MQHVILHSSHIPGGGCALIRKYTTFVFWLLSQSTEIDLSNINYVILHELRRVGSLHLDDLIIAGSVIEGIRELSEVV